MGSQAIDPEGGAGPPPSRPGSSTWPAPRRSPRPSPRAPGRSSASPWPSTLRAPTREAHRRAGGARPRAPGRARPPARRASGPGAPRSPARRPAGHRRQERPQRPRVTSSWCSACSRPSASAPRRRPRRRRQSGRPPPGRAASRRPSTSGRGTASPPATPTADRCPRVGPSRRRAARAARPAPARTASPAPSPHASRPPPDVPPPARTYHTRDTAVLDALQAGGAVRDDCLVDALTAGRSPSERATRLRRSCSWSRSPTRMAAAATRRRRGRRRRSDRSRRSTSGTPTPASVGWRSQDGAGDPLGGRRCPRSPPGTRRRGGASGAAGPDARVVENDPVPSAAPAPSPPPAEHRSLRVLIPPTTTGPAGPAEGKAGGLSVAPLSGARVRRRRAGGGGGDSDGTCGRALLELLRRRGRAPRRGPPGRRRIRGGAHRSCSIGGPAAQPRDRRAPGRRPATGNTPDLGQPSGGDVQLAWRCTSCRRS